MFNKSQPAQRALREIISERTRPVIVWVGSGLSAEAGLPTWHQLKETLLKDLYAKAFSMTDGTSLVEKADQIRQTDDYWVSFERLQEALGQTTYRDAIKAALKAAVDAPIPVPYSLLWRLPIRGMLTLNLDRMAVRGYMHENPTKTPIEFYGHQVGRLLPELHGQRQFIVNLHGAAEDVSTWVFTHSELRKLTSKNEYKDFLRICLSSFTNIFIGMSVDDVAVGKHLSSLATPTVHTPSHYWITGRTDARTDSWAERVGVRIIRYEVRDRSHGEVVGALSDLIAAVPIEPSPAPPVVLDTKGAILDLPETDVLSRWDTEDIRTALNQRASEILSENSEKSYQEFEKFTEEYDEAIHRAWYTSTLPGRNKLHGHTLIQQVATGAFGKVYKAQDESGNEVAVKVLLEEVRRNGELLQSFRRGVRSMRILQDCHVEGMVAYEKASEIPAFVTMEWIEGPNLTEAKQAQIFRDWHTILLTAIDLTRIIRKAHTLPQRVLHRDIRPANVMLRDYWTKNGEISVVVLDFDLSWHRDSREKSVVHTSAVGYLAPEQINERHDGSTRNAAVDSYGLGMTLYFVCGGDEPMPEQHKHTNYQELVTRATQSIPPSEWVSLPQRVARTIIGATRDKQNERWDLSQIESELSSLYHLNLGEVERASGAALVEELAARTAPMARYSWDADKSAAESRGPTGLSIRIQADEPAAQAILEVSWQSTGAEQRTGLGKYISRSTRSLSDQLHSYGWQVISDTVEHQSMLLRAGLSLQALRNDLNRVSQQLSSVLEGLRFAD